MLGVPSEGMASSNPLSLKGFAKHNAENLLYLGLATRDAGGGIVPLNFVNQKMLDAYEREKNSHEKAKTSANGADNVRASGQSSLSVGDVARQLKVTVKTLGYLVQHEMLCGVDTSELYRQGATVVTADSLAQFRLNLEMPTWPCWRCPMI
ncbi:MULTISPECIES: hypothetical protein [Pacificibacter]|uniref:hypothetical protein n=1 Tax=Pacificibacter TaxID=1042323 RepID=UPI002090A785|nr:MULTISPECIES: hypothetical protein [Pacificibacter]MDO6615921.1 hypothetical protein [Pacificibacter sp. 1_MG-2023]